MSIANRLNDVKEQAISALKSGKTPTQVSKEFNIARSTVAGWNSKLQTQLTTEVSEMELDDFLGGLQPIHIQGNSFKPKKHVDTNYAVVIGDTHFGSECEKTINIFYNVLDQLRPSKVILNGDTLDLLAVSRYPKDVRHKVDLLTERTRYAKFLSTIYDILGSDVEVIETNANHSGDGVEGRWWRYLSERLGEVACLPEVIKALSYDKVFLPQNDWCKVKLEESVALTEDLLVMHGDVVRKLGGMSARGMMDKWFTSIIMNHTHRMGMTAQRIPALGNRPDKSFIAYENGCACDLNPTYATAPNWQNGFSIVGFDREDNLFAVEQVIVQNGMAACATLGATIKGY